MLHSTLLRAASFKTYCCRFSVTLLAVCVWKFLGTGHNVNKSCVCVCVCLCVCVDETDNIQNVFVMLHKPEILPPQLEFATPQQARDAGCVTWDIGRFVYVVLFYLLFYCVYCFLLVTYILCWFMWIVRLGYRVFLCVFVVVRCVENLFQGFGVCFFLVLVLSYVGSCLFSI